MTMIMTLIIADTVEVEVEVETEIAVEAGLRVTTTRFVGTSPRMACIADTLQSGVLTRAEAVRPVV